MSQTMSQNSLAFLAVGTQILTKDGMDQFIRTLGKHRTHYAVNAKTAYRIDAEDPVDIVITEVEINDSSAYDLITTLKQNRKTYLYTILAVDQDSKDMRGLAQELEVDQLMIKPFTATQIKAAVESRNEKVSTQSHPDMILHQVDLALYSKDYRKAEKLIEVALQAAPTNPRVLYRAGLFYYQKPDYERSEELLYRSVSEDPHYAPALYQLAIVNQRKKEYKEALDLMLDAQMESPWNPERPIGCTRVQLDWGTQILKDSLIKHPGRGQTEYELGRFLFLQKQYPQAITQLRACRNKVDSAFHKEVDTLIKAAAIIGGIKEE